MLSLELAKKDFSRRLRLNSAIVNNRYWRLPVDDVGHENYMPVGRGKKSSEVCGRWTGLSVCKNVEGHEGKFLGVTDCTNRVVVRHRHLWCHRSACPVCFIRGWSVRGAGSIKGRLDEGCERGFGKVEHVVVSVSVADRGLDESVFRERCRKALFDVGVSGGGMVFHGYRIDRERGVLVWSPHYHVLGYVEGGYDRCRRCKGADCYACDGGFEGKVYKLYGKNGYIVRVLDERETVFGTAHYQLNHATLRLGVKRFHVVTWFGCCGNRKFKSESVGSKDVCPVCREEMVRSVYVGKGHIVKDVGHPDYVPLFVDDEFDENGEPNYMAVDGG